MGFYSDSMQSIHSLYRKASKEMRKSYGAFSNASTRHKTSIDADKDKIFESHHHQYQQQQQQPQPQHHHHRHHRYFTDDEDDDEQGDGDTVAENLLEEDAIKYAWWSQGLVQAPRLRRDWDRFGEDDDRKYQSLNAFFDTLFSVVITSLGLEVRNQQSRRVLIHWAQYFGIVLSLWLSTAGYSSRFDNDDVVHKTFWSLYGVGVLGILMHSTGDLTSTNSNFFALFLSLIYFLLTLQWFRTGIHLPRCRFFCTIQGSIMLVYSLLALVASTAYYYPIQRRDDVFWVLCLGYPIEIFVTLLIQELGMVFMYPHLDYEDARKEVDLPLHIQFHIDRFKTLSMMVLGQLASAIAWHPEQGFGSVEGLYASAGCGFISLVCLKIFIFDVDFLDTHDHAIRRSRCSGLTWLLLYPLAMGCLALTGSGVALLIAEAGKINSVPAGSPHFRQLLTCESLSVFLIISTIQRNLHSVPYVRVLRFHREHRRATLMTRIYNIQCTLQLGAAVFFGVLPYCQATAMQILVCMAIIMIFILCLNMVDELILLETVAHARERYRRHGGKVLLQKAQNLPVYPRRQGTGGRIQPA